MAADIDLRVRLDQVERELNKIPGWTRRDARKAVRALDREWRQAPKAVARAARQAEREWDQRMQGIRQVTANTFGDVVNDIGDAVEAFGSIGGPIGIATIAVAGMAAAFAAVSVAIVATVRDADKLIDSQRELVSIGAFSPVDPSAEQSIRVVNGAMDALGEIVNRVIIDIAANMAPSLEDIAVKTVSIALATEDLFREFLQGKNLLREFAVFMVDFWIQSFTGPIAAVLEGLDLIGQGFVALGATSVGNALSFLNVQFEGFTRGMSEFVVDQLGSGLKYQFDDMAKGTENYTARAQKLIGALAAKRRELAGVASAAQDAGGSIWMIAEATNVAMNAARDQVRAMAEAAAATRAAAEAEAKRQQEAIALAQQRAQAERELAGIIVSSSTQALQAFARTAEEQRAAAIVQTLAMQALAFARAAAEGGPFVGLTIGGIIVSTIGQLLSQIPGGGGGGGVGRVASAPQDSSRGTTNTASNAGPARLSGRSARDVRAELTVVQTYNHQVFDRATREATQRIGAPLRQVATRPTRRGNR